MRSGKSSEQLTSFEVINFQDPCPVDLRTFVALSRVLMLMYSGIQTVYVNRIVASVHAGKRKFEFKPLDNRN